MSDREMTLLEWVGRLPESHRARRELEALTRAATALLAEWDSRGEEWLDEMEALRAAMEALRDSTP